MKCFVLMCVCCLLTAMSDPAVAGKKPADVKAIEKKVVEKGVSMVAHMPEESHAGSAVNVKISVKNVGKEILRGYTQYEKYVNYDLTLLDPKGQTVPMTLFGKSVYGLNRRNGPGVFFKFAPGEEFEGSLNVARIFDLSQAGEYTLTIGCGFTTFGNNQKGIDVKIQKMTFKVVDEPR